MEDQTETLADRLNQEPVIFRGSTNSELGLILLCALIFWFPVGLILGALMGAVVIGLGIATLGVLLTIFIGLLYFSVSSGDVLLITISIGCLSCSINSVCASHP